MREKQGPRVSPPVWLWAAGTGLVLFLAIGTQGGGDVERQCAIAMTVCLVLGLLGILIRRRTVCVPATAWAAIVYFALNCAAGLYARFGNIAATDFSKLLAAFCVFMLVLCLVRQAQLRVLAAAASAVSAAFGLLSLDAASLGRLSTP